MSLPDKAMEQYFRLVTRFEPPQIKQIMSDLESGKAHPRDVKMKLAYEIVSIFNGDDEAKKAEAYFKQVFQQQNLPDDMPTITISEPVNIVDLIAQVKFTRSKSEARRLVQQNAVSLDDIKIETIEHMVQPEGEQILRVGRRRFLKICSDSS
jgi:tyrosyl-tRNA synthetase